MAAGGTVHADDVIDRTKIGWFQIMVLILGAMVLFTDGYNTHDFGTVAFAVREDIGFSYELQGMISSASIVGLFFGYTTLSPLSGYFGPKRVAILSVALYGVFSVLSSVAQDATQLLVLRFMTGMALASAIPATTSIVGEFAPKIRRSTFITLVYFGFSFGQLASGAFSVLLLEQHGWRAVLLAGGLMALAIAPVLYFFLPESIEYLVNRGHQPGKALATLRRASPQAVLPANVDLSAGENASQRVSVTELFTNGRSLGTLLFWLALVMNLIPNYFFANWLTTILVDVGFSDNQAIYVKMANDGAGMFVAFVIGPLMDRFGPYRVMILFFLGCAAVISGTGITLTYGLFVPMLIMAFLVGFFTSGVSKGSNAVGIHFYPTALRPAGIGWGLEVGRIGGAISPAVAGVLLGMGLMSSTLFFAAAVPSLFGIGFYVLMQKYYGNGRDKPKDMVQPEAAPSPVR